MDKKLDHLSIKQLQLHAFRNNIIHCHYDTWRKYIHLFNPYRIPKKIKKTKSGYNKLNTSCPNKAWHIDTTYFKGPYGKPIYIQVIIDSYSRAVISWVVSNKRNSEMTIQNFNIATKTIVPKILYCDGGGENINLNVKSFLKNKNIFMVVSTGKLKRLNARIEAFFNIIKNRYVNKYKVFTIEVLDSEFKKAVHLYNNSPSTHFNGATPNEVMECSYDTDSLKHQLNQKIKYAKIKRINHYNNKEVSHS